MSLIRLRSDDTYSVVHYCDNIRYYPFLKKNLSAEKINWIVASCKGENNAFNGLIHEKHNRASI